MATGNNAKIFTKSSLYIYTMPALFVNTPAMDIVWQNEESLPDFSERLPVFLSRGI